MRYKTGATDSKHWKDPVSEVDRKVEKLIRERLAEQFPSHDIIGEESKERPASRQRLHLGGRSDRRHH